MSYQIIEFPDYQYTVELRDSIRECRKFLRPQLLMETVIRHCLSPRSIPTRVFHRCISSATEPPTLPQELLEQIDQKTPLANSVNFYSRHFSVSTGDYNWPSTTREDVRYGSGGKGPFHLSQFVVDWAAALKPNKSVMCTKSSHISTSPCVHVYPDNLKVTFNSNTPSLDQVGQFQSQWILSNKPLDFITIEELPPETVHIYICCHAARDRRCGVIGKLLISTMREYFLSPPADLEPALKPLDIQVFGCSHVGGHKFAGNMMMYRPSWKQGIWYGRVLPQDIDEIVRETLLEGKIIGRHWRGGLPDGSWDPKEHITAEEAERRAIESGDQSCACQK